METLLSNEKAADFLGVASSTLPRWRWSRTGPPFLRVGRSIRYRVEDLQSWLESRRVETKDQAE